MNKFTNTITSLSNNALAVVAIILVLVGLFDALVFCESILGRQKFISKLESNGSTERFNCRAHGELSPDYKQQLLASNTEAPMPWYIVPEQESTRLRLKTIVKR